MGRKQFYLVKAVVIDQPQEVAMVRPFTSWAGARVAPPF
jgi:hypothetical protein